MTETMIWEVNRPAIKADVAEVVAVALAAATEISANAVSHLCVTADMSSAVWNTVGTHEVFTVTGAVRLRMWVLCTATLTDAADLAALRFGADNATLFIPITGAAGKDGVTLSAGGFWADNSGTKAITDMDTVVLDQVIAGGQDVGYQISGAALTGGVLEFHCVWEALSSSSNVLPGAGGAL